jgi:hypothetical protein
LRGGNEKISLEEHAGATVVWSREIRYCKLWDMMKKNVCCCEVVESVEIENGEAEAE